MEINIPGSKGFPPMRPPQWGPVILLLAVALAFSSFGTLVYTVEPDEVGVIQRFGKYERTTNPGLHFKLPFGIESVKKVKVTHVFKEEFGFRTMQAGVRSTILRGENENRQRGLYA
ncbi:MAG: hypothetical protein HY714_03770, partial [Candidatus Omnitrophica bacterium]|nr:hypothetical protein [Candidatus Omnitrophota bacterium]